LLAVNFSWSVVAYHEFEYDGNGNILLDENYFYEYDGFNRLRRVRENNSEGPLLVEYWYASGGQRFKKKIYGVDDENTTTIYIGKDFVRVINSSGTFDIKYVRDNTGTLLARFDPDNTTFYYHPDHLGSTRLVTDEEGEVVEETDYLPFGASITGGADRYTFTGQESDPETELMYYGARYYSPYLRQFMEPDLTIPSPYNPQALNRYSYTYNNPLKYVDKSGNVIQVPALLVPGIVGGLAGLGYYVVSTYFDENKDLSGSEALKYMAMGAVAGYVAVGLGGAVGALTFGTTLGEISVGGVPLWQIASQFAANFAYSITFSGEENIHLGKDQIITKTDVKGAVYGAIIGTATAYKLKIMDISIDKIEIIGAEEGYKGIKYLTVQAFSTITESKVENGERRLVQTSVSQYVTLEVDRDGNVKVVEDGG
jgi:RHS repeat-associated protein